LDSHGDYHWGHSGVHQRRSAARTQGAQTDLFTDYNKVMKSSISGGLITVVPVGFYVLSLIRHDSYGQGTGLLAGEAVLNDTVLMVVMKAITRRARPSEFLQNGAV